MSLRPEKHSMFHLIASARSGSQVRNHSRTWFASGQENSGHVSSHSTGSLVRARLTSIRKLFRLAHVYGTIRITRVMMNRAIQNNFIRMRVIDIRAAANEVSDVFGLQLREV